MVNLKQLQYQYYDALVNLINPIRDKIYCSCKPNKHISAYDDNNQLTEGLNIYTNMINYCYTEHDVFILFQTCLRNIYNIINRL